MSEVKSLLCCEAVDVCARMHRLSVASLVSPAVSALGSHNMHAVLDESMQSLQVLSCRLTCFKLDVTDSTQHTTCLVKTVLTTANVVISCLSRWQITWYMMQMMPHGLCMARAVHTCNGGELRVLKHLPAPP